MTLVWHLAHTDDWAEALARGSYAVSTRGLTLDEVGFIHCSYAHQLAAVVRLFYADDDAPLTLLGIDPEVLAAAHIDVRDEPGDPAHPESERFPHVYGAIPVTAVTVALDAQVVAGTLVEPASRAAIP